MSARLTAFVVWAAVAASAVFWLLRLVSSSPAAPSYTVTVATGGAPRGDMARVLGAPPQTANAAAPLPTEPALASRFKLLGVAAPRQGGDQVGLALIAVDGKPARGYQVGASIDGPLVLQSVHARGASLGAAGAPPQVTLELPPLPAPNTSSRPPGATLPGATPGLPPPPALPPPVAGVPGGSVGAVPGAPQPVQLPADGQEPQPLPAPPPNAPTGSSAR